MKKMIIIACGLIAAQACYGANDAGAELLKWCGKNIDTTILKMYHSLLAAQIEYGVEEMPPRPPERHPCESQESYLHSRFLEQEKVYAYEQQCIAYLNRNRCQPPGRPDPVFSKSLNSYGELCTDAELAHAQRKKEELREEHLEEQSKKPYKERIFQQREKDVASGITMLEKLFKQG